MADSRRQAAMEYYAALTFGDKLGLSVRLMIRHWAVLFGLSLFLIFVMVCFFLLLYLMTDLMDISTRRIVRYGSLPDLSLGETIVFIIYGLFLIYILWILSVGCFSLVLHYVSRRKASALEAIFAPFHKRPLGLPLSFILWGFVLLLPYIGLYLLFQLPYGSWLAFVVEQFIKLLMIIVTMYIADCLIRERHFKITETVTKPWALLRSNFWIFIWAGLFCHVLVKVCKLPIFLFEYDVLTWHGGGLATVGFMCLLSVLLFSAGWFSNFMLALTYKQAKARFLLGY